MIVPTFLPSEGRKKRKKYIPPVCYPILKTSTTMRRGYADSDHAFEYPLAHGGLVSSSSGIGFAE